MYNIVVLTIERYENRLEKYDSRYKFFIGVDGLELDEDHPYMKKISCRYNISDKQKRNVVGCLLSHLKVMQWIIHKKMNNVIIIEDDAIIDFDYLDKIDLNKLPKDKMIYFGGIIRGLTLKSDFDYNKIKDIFYDGLNVIDSKKYKIGATHGYYFPTWEVAEKVYLHITKKDKIKAIDGEFALIQKDNPELCNMFIYPAISYLNLKEAKKGFSSKYGIPRDMKYY